ncbi:MAG TPA: hypothetical protein VK095_06015 [Beutenbergiaceae bacterium]|nr:hypothetical protein [Beutenbergiaceae bacterium]
MTSTMTTRASAEEAAESADLALLSGPDSAGLVEAVLSAEAADVAAIQDLQVQVDQVHHRPGSGVSVGYRISYRTPAGQFRDYVVASTSPQAGDGPGVAVLDDGDRTVRMWRRSSDPALPGLRQAVDPVWVHHWLTGAGLELAPAKQMNIDVLSYRPTRRAVLRVSSDAAVVYLKILPPRRSAALAKRHQLLQDAQVPAPRLLARSADGILALSAARGRPMAEAVAAYGSRPDELPAPQALVQWLDRLPPGVSELRRRPSWSDRVAFHARTASGTLGDRSGEITELGSRLADFLADLPEEDLVPTHGDYYEANVFTEAGQVRDVIDVDSLGPGRRSDDLATMLGHLAVLPALAPQTYAEAHRVIRKTQEAFEAQVPPRSLRARTAAVVLSLVGGARTDQANARLDEAQEWFASAGRTRRGAARHLRELSSAAPAGLIHGAEDQSITRTTREAGQSKEKS